MKDIHGNMKHIGEGQVYAYFPEIKIVQDWMMSIKHLYTQVETITPPGVCALTLVIVPFRCLQTFMRLLKSFEATNDLNYNDCIFTIEDFTELSVANKYPQRIWGYRRYGNLDTFIPTTFDSPNGLLQIWWMCFLPYPPVHVSIGSTPDATSARLLVRDIRLTISEMSNTNHNSLLFTPVFYPHPYAVNNFNYRMGYRHTEPSLLTYRGKSLPEIHFQFVHISQEIRTLVHTPNKEISHSARCKLVQIFESQLAHHCNPDMHSKAKRTNIWLIHRYLTGKSRDFSAFTNAFTQEISKEPFIF